MNAAPSATDLAMRILEHQACQRSGCDCRSAARRGHGRTHCPVHADYTASLNVQERGGQLLVYCHAGCDQAAVIGALRELELGPEPAAARNGSARSIAATYDYVDEHGVLALQVVRYLPKDFRQRRPDGAGGWIWNLDGVRRVLYRLPELLASDAASLVLVLEGEKDVDRARGLGLVATCNVGGAGKWRAEYSETLRGRDVVLIPDNDTPGRVHMRRVADSLRGVARSVRVIELPGLPEHGDLSAWLDLGHTRDELLAACAPPPAGTMAWPEPEDFGEATPSTLAEVEYIEDLVRPGRITVVAAEEGAGKSYAVDDDMCIRLACAGGTFAETWRVRRCGGVLVLSEMHRDDDLARRDVTLRALELERSALVGKYWRLPLLTAANGTPVLDEPDWCKWAVGWCREHGVIAMVLDTGTGATRINPWGTEFQAVYARLRLMLESYPELAIVVLVHCKKPQGHGERRITDILGEWGRWCDITIVLERDGLTRVRLTLQKRVSRPRRIVALQRDGLLVDVQDITDGKGPKVPLERVVEAVSAEPGLGAERLAAVLSVSKMTALKYLREAENSGYVTLSEGVRGAKQAYPTVHRKVASNIVGGQSLDGGVATALHPLSTVQPSYIEDGGLDGRSSPSLCGVCGNPSAAGVELCASCEEAPS